MANNDWAIAIATIILAITTLLAPTLAMLVQSRINQPKTKPNPSQPRNRIWEIFLDVFTFPMVSVWFAPVACLVMFVVSAIQFRQSIINTEPVTREVVVRIALDVGALITIIVMFIMWLLIQLIFWVVEQIPEPQKRKVKE